MEKLIKTFRIKEEAKTIGFSFFAIINFYDCYYNFNFLNHMHRNY